MKWRAIQLHVDPQMLARIEDFHHEHRMFGRTKTIRFLINWALDNHPKPKKKGQLASSRKPKAKSQKRRPSSSGL